MGVLTSEVDILTDIGADGALAGDGAVSACRFCGAPLRHTFVDLGMSPLCESYVPADRVGAMEAFYPLHAKVCEGCLLVQLEEFVAADAIFSEYAYFSSYSDSWVAHARNYVEAAVGRFGVDAGSLVVELASNDGYLLQHVVARGIPALGIEPAANVARVAQEKGIETVVEFFGRELAGRLVAEGRAADLLVANNVMAHVPDLNDFVGGIGMVLAPGGVATIEVPHLLRLVESNQFDTIYHEHFSYFSLLRSHGGSLRLYAQRAGSGRQAVSSRVHELAERERGLGFDTLAAHRSFSHQVNETKWCLLEFLIARRREGKRIAGYGAPGKGNTLLNFCGVRTDLLEYTVDRNPYKQGQFLPGTHIPIKHPKVLEQERPDYILILPWNLQEEIVEQLAHAREWGAQFIIPIPEVQVL
jgi:SAM-dependent methyltransferase